MIGCVIRTVKKLNKIIYLLTELTQKAILQIQKIIDEFAVTLHKLL